MLAAKVEEVVIKCVVNFKRRRIIVLFKKIGVTESNGHVRILSGSSEIAASLCACALQIWPKAAQNGWRDDRQPRSRNISQLPLFSCFRRRDVQAHLFKPVGRNLDEARKDMVIVIAAERSWRSLHRAMGSSSEVRA